MDQLLTFLGMQAQSAPGESGPGWVALAGVVLFIVLGLYAGLMLNAQQLPRWLRPPSPASLRPRIAVALVLVATAGVVLGWMAADSAGRLLVAPGWLIAALIFSVCVAMALARSIAGPLHALDRAVRRFDPELQHEVPEPPPGAPREVAVVFEHLAEANSRQRAALAQLQHALQQGERLRREFMTVLEDREAEVLDRTRELQQANERVDNLSRTDALTGVANRRGLADFLDRAWRAALRDQRPVSVLMVDIDHFNAYNDAYGYPQGDTCLQAVANSLTHVVGRATDLVARYGGEKFVAVLGNTPLEGALLVGEQIRAAIEGMAIPHKGAPAITVVTVSVGVTSSLPVRGTRPDTGLEAAERAVHAAKEQGRNRVGYSSVARTGLFQSLCLANDSGSRPS